MLWGLLRSAEEVLDYDRPRGLLGRAGPAALSVTTLILWAGLSLAGLPRILAPMALVAVYHLLSGRERMLAAARSSLYPSVLVGVVAALLGPEEPLTRGWMLYVATVTLRVYGIASTALIFLGELGPEGAVCVARVHPFMHDVTMLLYRLAPLTVRDVLTGAWAQRLLGKGPKDALVGATLSAVRRAEMLEASLYARGARPGRREPPCPVRGGVLGPALTGAALLSLLAVLL